MEALQTYFCSLINFNQRRAIFRYFGEIPNISLKKPKSTSRISECNLLFILAPKIFFCSSVPLDHMMVQELTLFL